MFRRRNNLAFTHHSECVRLLEANRGELGSHGGAREQVRNSNLKSSQTTDYTKLRLKRDRPDLYERVINGDMTDKQRPENAVRRNSGTTPGREKMALF